MVVLHEPPNQNENEVQEFLSSIYRIPYIHHTKMVVDVVDRGMDLLGHYGQNRAIFLVFLQYHFFFVEVLFELLALLV